MAGRSHSTFKKRQKEMARVEKQREKAAKRLQKKEEGPTPESNDEMLLNADDDLDDFMPVVAMEGADSGQSVAELLKAERLHAQSLNNERAKSERPEVVAEA